MPSGCGLGTQQSKLTSGGFQEEIKARGALQGLNWLSLLQQSLPTGLGHTQNIRKEF
jgi:hypothetical protein